MLTPQENELMTRVGPGTPCGDLFRRYWHPVAVSSELTEERPMKRLRMLGEDLVLFRTADGAYGLVAEHCSHRGASLYYGFLEDGCIRCPYHGWLYDLEGHCVEQPFEPQQSMMKHTIKHPAYPVQKLGGLLWTYMGPPEKQPLLPRWDVLARGRSTPIDPRPVLHCNWLQAEENTADSRTRYSCTTTTMSIKGISPAWTCCTAVRWSSSASSASNGAPRACTSAATIPRFGESARCSFRTCSA